MPTFGRALIDGCCYLGLCCACWSGVARATDGVLGTTSSATVEVKFSIPDSVKISTLSDLNLGAYDGANGARAQNDFCVYRRGGKAANYGITLSSAHAQGTQFRMAAGNNFLAYSVQFSKRDGSAAVAVASGTPLQRQGEANYQSLNCELGGLTNTLSVAVSPIAADVAAHGEYVDTITLLVAPF